MSENTTEEKTIRIDKLLKTLLKRLWIMLLCAAIGGGGMYLYVVKKVPDTYTAFATFYVYNSNPNLINYQYTSTSDLNTATRLMETYMVVIRSNKVLDVIAERLNGEYSTQFIANSISLGSVSGTEVMRVNVTTTDPDLSMRICNAMADTAPAELLRVVNAGSVEVIDYATLPAGPDNKGAMKKALIGAFAGAALAAAVIFLFFLLDHRVHDESDLTDRYAVSVLGTIPDLTMRFPSDKITRARPRKSAKRKTQRYLLSETTSPAVVEAYRMLRGNLRFAMSKGKQQIIIVSSAVPGEGKTTVCSNLAVICAQDGRRILLIDADLRKPRQAVQLGVPNLACGLTTVLQGIDSFENAVQHNLKSGLDFLPAGAIPPNPSELLGSPAMEALLDRARFEYDTVIIDTAPVNVVGDALLLSGYGRALLFIVKQDFSDEKEIDQALHAIEFSGTELLGFVMTNMHIKSKHGSKHYAKYYRSYYSYEETPANDSHSRTRNTRGAKSDWKGMMGG